MDYRAYDFVTSLRAFNTSDQIWDSVCSFFKAEGFMMVSHGYLPNTDAIPQNKQTFVASNIPPSPQRKSKTPAPMRFVSTQDAMDFFFHHGFKYDPILYKPTVGFDPYLTGPDFTTSEQFGDKYFNIMNEVKTLGMSSGFVAPLVDYGTGNIGRFAIGTPLVKKDIIRLINERADTYKLIMLLADEYLRALPSQSDIEAMGLSPREVECLLWLAQGYRVDRIASRLNITNATVNLHFANVKKKLQASTREQALVKAIVFGIIRP
jgi:DNA-binding CsgD family transcriptional regulator